MSTTAPAPPTSPLLGTAPGLVMLAGAGVYALLQGLVGVTFNATPFTVGLIVGCAGLVGRRQHLLPTALVLIGWGAGVLAVHAAIVPGERITPAYMVGIGLGLVATAALAPAHERGGWLVTASISTLTAPLAFYLVYDFEVLGRWPAWTLTLVAWALWEMWAGRSQQRET